MDDSNFNNLGLDFPLDGTGDLDNFDFDSFLNSNEEGFGFDVNTAFDGDPLVLDGGN